MITGSIQAGRSLGAWSSWRRVVDGVRAGADGGATGATGAAVSDTTARSGATFGVHAGVAIGVQVCWAGEGATGAGGVD